MTHLTSEQVRFKDEIVDRLPELEGLFDWQRKEYKADVFRKIVGSYSHGQACMARFAVAVWLGENKSTNFDVFEAISVLDEHRMGIILNWLRSPFWP